MFLKLPMAVEIQAESNDSGVVLSIRAPLCRQGQIQELLVEDRSASPCVRK